MNNNRKHHKSEFGTWIQMKYRCSSPKSNAWIHYGGRGITVCRRWMESFDNFLEDMGPKPSPKHSLHRTDNDGNYEPGNCRWATALEHAKNKRPPRKDRVVRREFGVGDIRRLLRAAINAGITHPSVEIRLTNGTKLVVGGGEV